MHFLTHFFQTSKMDDKTLLRPSTPIFPATKSLEKKLNAMSI